MAKHPAKPPSDPNQAAVSILAQITGETPKIKPPAKEAVDRGRKGGLKGGEARASALTPAERKASAQKAAEARWGQKGSR